MGNPSYGPWAIPKTISKINISFSNLIISFLKNNYFFFLLTLLMIISHLS
jgi:hypothetical protein